MKQTCYAVYLYDSLCTDRWMCVFSCENLANGFHDYYRIVLLGGSEIYDPCEKTPTDAFEYLCPQEREDLTNSAQVLLLLVQNKNPL